MSKPEGRAAYPLAWPDLWPRTAKPTSSGFRTSIEGALENVRKSLAAFAKDSGKQVTDVVISSNVTLGEPTPRDAGVAIYFTWDGLPTCIAVDRYGKPQENLQAIHHCIEAERTKLRHGGINLVRAAFRGYAALPPPMAAAAARPWFEVLELPPSATLVEVELSYKRLRGRAHPDRGGSPQAFNELQNAIAAARAALS